MKCGFFWFFKALDFWFAAKQQQKLLHSLYLKADIWKHSLFPLIKTLPGLPMFMEANAALVCLWGRHLLPCLYQNSCLSEDQVAISC